MPENHTGDTTMILDCPTGRDYLSLDLANHEHVELTLDDRETTLARGATRLSFSDAAQLHNEIGRWLAGHNASRHGGFSAVAGCDDCAAEARHGSLVVLGEVKCKHGARITGSYVTNEER
jgi:hypothetical protein